MREATKLQRMLILRSPSALRSSLMRAGVVGEELEESIAANIEAHKAAAKEFGLEAELAEVLSIEGWIY